MNLLGVRPANPSFPSEVATRVSKDLDEELRKALVRHKKASDDVITKSLDQVQRSADVSIAVKSIVDRVERSAAADTMEEAYRLVLRGKQENDDDPEI